LGDIYTESLEIGWRKIPNRSCRPDKASKALGDLPAVLRSGCTNDAGLDLLELVVEIVVADILDGRTSRVYIRHSDWFSGVKISRNAEVTVLMAV